MKKIAAGLLSLLLAFPVLADRQVTDDAGHPVILPDRVTQVAEGGSRTTRC
jgi:iron complex transport system substrate-binding protein